MSNNSYSGNLIKNLLSITSGQFLNLFLSFLSITLAARYLGVENFGKFGYLLAVVSVVSKIIDFGFTPIVFRELSISKKYELLNSAIIFRLLAFFIVAILLNIILFFFNTSLTEQILLNLLLTNSLISARFICVRELLDVPFKVELKMHYPMLFTNIDNIVLFFTVLLLPFYEDKLTLFIVGYVLSNLPGLFLTLFFLHKKFGYFIKINLSSIKYLLKESLPLYGFIVLDALYQQLDVILLKNLSSYHDAGIYSVALRLSTPLLIIPTAIIHTIFPTLSKNFTNSKNDNSFIINLIFKILFILSFSISIVFFFYSKNIILLIFGEKYIFSTTPTTFLLFSQIFIFFNYFVINIFVAINKQSIDFFYSVLILVINTILNILLIPSFSYIGCSWAKLISSFIGFLFLFIIMKRIFKKTYLLDIYFLAWVCLSLVFGYLLSYFNLFVFLPIFIVYILTSVFFVGLIKSDEAEFLIKLLHLESLKLKIFNIWSRNGK